MASLSPAELLDWLEQNQFLSPPQVEPMRTLLVSFPDSHALARELIRRDWLTPFQVNQILQGKHDFLIVDSYRLRERIGEGAMGQVFKAWQPRVQRIVAIKMILKNLVNSAKALERFRREVEAAGRLEHPNIARVHDAGETDGRPYLVMEFIDGFNLSTHVKLEGALPIHVGVDYVRQTALGLQHAHEQGIVHRDIKPGNLLVLTVNATRVVKILDFGLARFESEQDDTARLTEVGKLLGTIDYIAPEQAHDARGADIRADIYSLGCTLFYLLTARPPFLGENIVEKLGPRLTGEAPWIRAERPEIAPALEEVIRKMMARRPEDRYQTPLEVAEVLERFAAPLAMTLPTTAPAAGPVVMAMPVSTPGNDVPMAQPIAKPGRVTAVMMEPDAATSVDVAFSDMTASGRDVSTGASAATPATPTVSRGSTGKLAAMLGGGVLLLSLVSCLCVLGFFFYKDGPSKKNGTLRITNAKWSTGDKKLIPGNHHHVLVWIERVDFKGPVKVRVKDLPAGVESDTLVLAPNVDSGQVKVTVSFGTEPITKPVRVYADCEEAGAKAEFPLTLTVKEDPLKLKK